MHVCDLSVGAPRRGRPTEESCPPLLFGSRLLRLQLRADVLLGGGLVWMSE